MSTLAKRCTGTPVTSGVTWAATANAVDGTPPTSLQTYATWTSAVSGATGYIEIGGFNFANEISSSDTLTSVTVLIRHLEASTVNISNVQYQAYDGATAIGTIQTATRAAAARSDSAVIPVTLAQLRSANFKVRVTVTHAANVTSSVFSLDHIDVTVDFTALPVLSQNAFCFYTDGTETASVAIAAQDTWIVRDLTDLDASLFLRVRMQNNEARSLSPTDDYQLQFDKNSSGAWTNLGSGGVIGYDSGPITEGVTATTNRLTGGTGTFVAGKVAEDGLLDNLAITASNFTELLYTVKLTYTAFVHLDTIRFRVLYNGSTTGITYTQYPTITVNKVTLSITQYVFSGDGLEATTAPLAAQNTGYSPDLSAGNVNMMVRYLLQNTGPYDSYATDDYQLQWEKNASGTWTNITSSGNSGVATWNKTGMTTGDPTTNRLTGGTGTFVPGRVLKLGLGTDFGLTGYNFTEFLFTFVLKAADLANADVIRFRLNRNSLQKAMTYVVTPTLTVIKPLPKVETFTDTFDTQVDKATKWMASSTETVWDASARCKIPVTTSYYALGSAVGGGLDLTGSYLLAQMTPPAVGNQSRETFMEVIKGGDTTNRFSFFVSGTSFMARQTINGTHNNGSSLTYNPAVHVWWKIREASGTVYFDWSTNGLVWNNLWSTTPAFPVTNVYANFVSGYWGTETAADTFIDNVNVPPAASTGGRPKVWTGSAWANKPAKVWNGSAWVEKPMKVWTGTVWKAVT